MRESLTLDAGVNAGSDFPDNNSSEPPSNKSAGFSTLSRSPSISSFAEFVADPECYEEKLDDVFFDFTNNPEPDANASSDLPVELMAELKILDSKLSAKSVASQSRRSKESPREHESPRERLLPKRLSAVMSFDPAMGEGSQAGSPRESRNSPLSGSPTRSQQPISPREVDSPRSACTAQFFQPEPPREVLNRMSASPQIPQLLACESVYRPTKSSSLPIAQPRSRLRRSSLPVTKTAVWARYHQKSTDAADLSSNEVKGNTL